MLTGVVMEKDNNNIVVLTDSGEFRRVKIVGRMPEIGDEVKLPVRTRRTWTMPRLGWIAAAAAVLLFMLVSPLAIQLTQPPETAVAWVSIDINPAIELTVSDREKVMVAQAYNRDGEKILARLDVKGMKVKKAVSEITSMAHELGYMGKSKDNNVLISVAVKPTAGIDSNELKTALLASVNEVLQGDATLRGTVQVVGVPTELREKAVEKKITAGKYAVLIEAVTKYKLNVTEDDMKEKSVTKAIADAGGKVDDVLAKAREEKEFNKNEKEYVQIASERQTIAAAGIDKRGSENAADSKDGKEQGADNKQPDNDHRYVEKIRGGKDPESVADNTYKDDQSNQGDTGNNNSTGNQTDDNQKPPVQPEQPPETQPDTDRGGLQQNTGNYVIAAPPVDDQGMYLRKPNF